MQNRIYTRQTKQQHATTHTPFHNPFTPTMAASNYTQTTHPSTTFVESAGGILFDPTTREICLLHHRARAQRLLPKGRRNVGESRARAAVREV